jgi:hypothetical protein
MDTAGRERNDAATFAATKAAAGSPQMGSPLEVLLIYLKLGVSSVKTPKDFGVALVGFVLLTVWRVPPLLVVVVGAIGGISLALAKW